MFGVRIQISHQRQTSIMILLNTCHLRVESGENVNVNLQFQLVNDSPVYSDLSRVYLGYTGIDDEWMDGQWEKPGCSGLDLDHTRS